MKLLALVLLFSMTAAGEHPKPEIRKAIVISQELGTDNGGTAVLPMGTGIIGVPLTRHSNVVVIQTNKARVSLVEMANKHFVILPVNGEISFYTDKNAIVITDNSGKKHKFGITHVEQLPQENK